MISMDLNGPMHWIWKERDGFGGFQTLDLEGLRWSWRVPVLGFRKISVDLDGPRPWSWKNFGGFGWSQALELEGVQWIWMVPGIGFGRISMDLTPTFANIRVSNLRISTF